MSKLKLTTRLDSMNETHGRLTVFQNGGNAGQLCVAAEHAEAIVGLIAAAVNNSNTETSRQHALAMPMENCRAAALSRGRTMNCKYEYFPDSGQ